MSNVRTLQRLLEPVVAPSKAALGVDVVHIPTWSGIRTRTGPALDRRVYTDGELHFAQGRPDRLATRLAAKEAVLKLLGTGIRGIGLRDVEVVSNAEGEPTVVLHGPARDRHAELLLGPIAVSLCHEEDMAYAVVVALPARASGGGEQ